MWVDYKKAPNLMIAEMWKDVLEGDGLPTKILPEGDIITWGERVPFRVLVPKGREHVADEIAFLAHGLLRGKVIVSWWIYYRHVEGLAFCIDGVGPIYRKGSRRL